MHTYTYIYIHIHIYIYLHTYIYIHILAKSANMYTYCGDSAKGSSADAEVRCLTVHVVHAPPKPAPLLIWANLIKDKKERGGR